MFKIRLIFLVLSVILFISSPAIYSAQNAWVGAEGSVYAQAEETGTPVYVFKPGEQVRIGNEPKNGWYAVLLPPGAKVKTGWISSSNILTQQQKSDMRGGGLSQVAPVSRKAAFRQWSIEGEYNVLLVGANDFQDKLGLVPTAFYASMPGGLIGFRPTLDWNLGIRVGMIAFTGVFSNAEAGLVGSYVGKGTYVGALFQYLLWNSRPWALDIGFGGGMLVGGGLTAVLNGVTLVGSSFSAPGFDGNLTFRLYPFGDMVGLYARAGYLYLLQKTTTINAVAAGAKYGGPVFGGGLMVDL